MDCRLQTLNITNKKGGETASSLPLIKTKNLINLKLNNMKTIYLKQIIAIVIAGILSTFYVHSQTIVSGTNTNSCGAGTYGTTNTNVGCYAGASSTSGDRNVAIGDNALFYNTTGDQNTAVGYQAGQDFTGSGGTFIGQRAGTNNTSGDYNVFVGENCAFTLTTGSSNCFIGAAAGYTSTSCTYNVFSGYQTGYYNTTGSQNVFLGGFSGYRNTTASENTYLGYSAGYNNTGATNTVTGFQAGYGVNGTSNYTNSTFLGWKAGNGATTGDNNTFTGYESGKVVSSGGDNTFYGYQSGLSTTTGNYNVFIGDNSGRTNVSGQYNAFLGMNSGYDNTGSYNTILGHNAGIDNSSGNLNVIIGYTAGYKNTTGSSNTFVGVNSGHEITTTSGNTFVGENAGYDNTSSYNTAIGRYAGDDCVTCSLTTFIGYLTDATNNYTNSTALGYQASITDNNQIRVGNSSIGSIGGYEDWTDISDSRVKKNVEANVPGLEFILRLRPVTYNFDIDLANELSGVDLDNGNNDSLQNGTNEAIDWPSKYDKEQRLYSGFLAQEVDSIANSIGYSFSGVDKSGELMGLRYAKFTVPLVKAIQEQQAKIEELEALIHQCCTSGSEIKNENAEPDKITSIELQSADNSILYQNAPNPFATETTINYYLPQTINNAKMVFYNDMGQSIKEILLEHKGNASVKVQSSDLANGFYSYSLIVNGNVVDTKRMLKK